MKRGRKKQTKGGARFWDTEYKRGTHLALSDAPSEDLQKFLRWLERTYGRKYTNVHTRVLDVGCGNGRNLIHIAKEYGAAGVGIDVSSEAIAQARAHSEELALEYITQSIAQPLPVADASVTMVLDMMTSHMLDADGRAHVHNEILRVLKPGGWLLFKTFLLEEDIHAKQLLRDHPADEPGSYIHPRSGMLEHVYTEAEIEELLEPNFTIHKTSKSHKHIKRGKPHKRRNITVYAQKR